MADEDNDDELFPNLGSTTTDPIEIPVQFVNKCSFPVDVFWMNFERTPTKFGTLLQNQHFDIKTFKHHPWVARRSSDGVKLEVNGNAVFWSEPGSPNVCTQCVITPKVLSLKEMASRTMIMEGRAIDLLRLPRDLQLEVRGFHEKMEEYFEIVRRSVPPPVRRPPSPPAAQ
ncbi:hypothetical protein CAEBREN_02271 [Caenorhabditis brenneri]|uniref:von Hippel-Lindau disease tumour suppressor beta domain-containing protein n=1 Tax=Caenorhabditis brenneri TaxID=135651 RepID=G0MMS6_CAEBE|nr:hypothetical protein CAEBREN_02271 [Caenorhabditis brenneri]